MKTLTVIDNFSKHAHLIRHLALQQPVREADYLGHKYPGVICDPEFEAMLLDHLGPLICNKGGFQTIYPVLSFFRLGVAGHKPQIYIHADNAMGAEYNAVFCLNPPESCHGGTAFWTHQETGWTRLPPKAGVEAAGFTMDQGFCDRMNLEGSDESFWEMNGLVSMAWNRMIIFPSDLWHSRYPKDYTGQTPQTGRLVWVCFFNTSPPAAK